MATDKSNLSGESAQVDVQVEEAALPPTGGNLSCDVRQIYRADGSECMGMTTAAASSGISPPGAPARTACPPTW